MDDLISLLDAVYATMDTISVTRIDNQDKFVGCANAVKKVADKRREMNLKKEDAADGRKDD